MRRFAPVPALFSVALFAVGVYAACNKTSVFITTGQFPPGGSNIIITVSDPAVCAPPGGHFAHLYITITDVEASKEPTAEAHSSSLVDLTPDLAAQPVQVDLLGQPDTRCTLGLIAHGFAKPGTYKMLRVHLLATPAGPNGKLPPIAGGNRCDVSATLTANCLIQTNGAVLPLGVLPRSYFDIGPDALQGGELVVSDSGVTQLNLNIDGCGSLVPVVSSGTSGSYSFRASARAMVLDQAAAISGSVADGATGGPIDGREIVALEQPDGTGIDRIVMETTPDADGAFVLCPVPAGNYDLVAVAVKRAQTAYAPTVVLDVPAGTATGTIALLRAGTGTATTSTEPATLVGQVSLLAGTGRGFGQVRVSALAQTSLDGSTLTFTVPLPQSTAGTISIAGPSAIPYSFRVPAANPRVAVYSGGRLNFTQDTGRRPSFTIEAQGCGSTKTTSAPVPVTAGGTASAPILTITTCNPA